MKNNYFSQGYIALVGVLLLGSALLVALLALSLGMVSGSKMARSQISSESGYFLSSSCAEEALEKLWEDSQYQGNEVLTFDNGLCGILPIEDVSGGKKLVKVYGSTSGYTRRTEITISTTTPQIVIDDWREVADF